MDRDIRFIVGEEGTLKVHDNSHRDTRERGAVLVEFSLVVVIFVALLYGLIAYGMAFALKESMTNAASEAARSAVGAPTGSEETTAYATANDRLGWLGAKCCTYEGGTEPDDPMVLDAATGACANNTNEQCITVKATYDYERSPLVPVMRLPGFTYLFPNTIKTEATVQLPPAP